MAYNSFPYVSMHELNLDYLLNKSKEVQANVEASAGSASAAAASAAAAAGSADASLTYSRNSANSAAASEASAADSAESARIAVAAAGDPITFTAASQLTNTSKIYVYIGETGTYTYGHWYYYAGGAWIDGGVYGTWATDDVLDPDSTNAVQNRVIYNAVSELNSDFEYVDHALNSVNTLQLDDRESYTDGGLTISITNGVITVAGTATKNVIVSASIYVGLSGQYYFDGCPAGGTSSMYYQRLIKDSVYYTEVGGGRIYDLESGHYQYEFVVVSGRTVDFTVTPRLIWIETDSTFMPAILYGGWSAAGTGTYNGSYETWANNRKRTDIMYLKSGSIVGFQGLGSVVFTVHEYRNYNPAFVIATNDYNGTTFTWEADHDGYYAFNFRRGGAQTLTKEDVLNNCTFYLKGRPDYRPRVHFIGSGNLDETATASDVGDCTLITFYDGNNLLIDTGNARNYVSTEKRLYAAGVKKVNNIIISHYHSDHIGGLIEWMARTYVDIEGATVYLPDPVATQWAADNGVMETATKDLWDQAMQIFEDKNCTLIYPNTEWQTVKISNAFITFFNVDLSVYENRSTNYNDWSLCNYLIYGNMNVCFTGDLGPIAQSVLTGTLYKSNVYKADHHGWLNQPDMAAGYIENVSPDVVIAEDGQTHDDLLVGDRAPLIRWCEANGVPYYRKYQNNEIVLALDDQAFEFFTKVKRYYRPTT